MARLNRIRLHLFAILLTPLELLRRVWYHLKGAYREIVRK